MTIDLRRAWAGWLLGALIAASAACRPSPHEAPQAEGVATVNGESISAAAYSKALVQARRDNENLSPRTASDLEAFRKAVLDDLIDRTLLLQAARANGVSVQPERVDREILRLKADYPGPAFDQALAEGAQTSEDLRDQTRIRLTIEQYFAERVFARIAITDDEVEAWYKSHSADFAHDEEVHALQILVEDPDSARRVQADLKKGERFEELARRYSVSPDARVGGDLGFFPRGRMPEVFDQTCFSLAPGKVSDVVTSPYGYHLFKVLEKRPAGLPPLQEVRGRVETALRKDRETAAQSQAIESLRASAKISTNLQLIASL